MTLCFRQCQAQIQMLAFDHFNVLMLNEFQISGAHEAVDHEAYHPRHFLGHRVGLGKNATSTVTMRARFFIVRQSGELLGCSQKSPVFSQRKTTTRLGLQLDFRERRNFIDDVID
jgi:hypothetical protein